MDNVGYELKSSHDGEPDFVIDLDKGDAIGSTLAMRPGEWVTIWPDFRLDMEPLYALALVETPPVPQEFVVHGNCTGYALVCAGWFYANDDDEKTWGWVHLEPETKEYLGNMMLQINAKPGRWYYIEITREKPFPVVPRVSGVSLE